MTHCDVSVRSAREEMRHVGSSEPGAIIGSDKDQNRECKKKWNSSVSCMKRKWRAVATSCIC